MGWNATIPRSARKIVSLMRPVPRAGIAILLVSVNVSAMPQHKPAVTSRKTAGPTYAELLEKVKRGDLTIDFTELRMKYAASPEYDPEEGSLETVNMYARLDTNNYDGALSLANTVLEKQYVNIDAHIVASRACQALHDETSAGRHYNIAMGLVNSILHSGSGASPASAYKVISESEERAVSRLMNWFLFTKSTTYRGKRRYDEWEVFDPGTSSEATVYFDVTLSDEYREKTSGK